MLLNLCEQTTQLNSQLICIFQLKNKIVIHYWIRTLLQMASILFAVVLSVVWLDLRIIFTLKKSEIIEEHN